MSGGKGQSGTNGFSGSNPIQQPASSANEAPKSVFDLIPVREDIGTEWRISSTPIEYNSTKGYLGNSINALKVTGTNSIAPGYLDSATQSFSKKSAALTVTIATFDSHDNAKSYYSSVTNKLYAEGGFKQLDTRTISAECFSVFREGNIATRSDFYCVKENVYFTLKEGGGLYDLSEDVQNDSTNFVKILAGKVNGEIASAESLSFGMFAGRICNRDYGCWTNMVLANHNVSGCEGTYNKDDCI